MSILIKALKQAERDHQARAAALPPAATFAQPDIEASATPAPAPRSSEALSLAPVDPVPDPVAAVISAASEAARALHEDAANGAQSAQEALREDGDVPPARVVPAVLQTTRADTPPAPAAPRGVAPARAGAARAVRPGADTRPDTAASTAGAEAAAEADALSEQRLAARQLVAAAPRPPLWRRSGFALAGGAVLVGILAAGFAWWQGLYTPFASNNYASMAPAPSNATPPAPPAEHAAHAPAGVRGAKRSDAAAATDGASGAAGPIAAAPMAVSPAAATTAAGHRNSADDAPRAADGIHLRAPEASPERIRALLAEAYAAAALGDADAAHRTYQQVIDVDRNNGDAWNGLASLAANAGDAAGARSDYRRALEIDPGDSIALGGLLGLQSGVDPQEAESRLRLLMVREGAQPALLAALGRLLARQGRWLEAQESFFQAWTADPSQPDVAFNLAVSLERIRQPAVALTYYQRALDLGRTRKAHFDAAVAQERVLALTPRQPE